MLALAGCDEHKLLGTWCHDLDEPVSKSGGLQRPVVGICNMDKLYFGNFSEFKDQHSLQCTQGHMHRQGVTLRLLVGVTGGVKGGS